ncbi:MAG: glycosyltransferase family 2 protein [Patulibacter minatonensis]
MHPEPVSRELERITVVSPVYNEVEGISGFVDRAVAVLETYPDWELILVDDGSKDGTRQVLRELSKRDPRIRVVGLARNFGQPIATSAGLAHSSGELTVMIDSDLQDPPEVIHEMVEAWRNGSEVVLAIRRERAGETAFKLITARMFYRGFSRLTGVHLQENAGDFRALGRPALDTFLDMPERGRFLRGMTTWIGFKQAEVYYDRDARTLGKTSYSKRKLMRLAFDAIASFSHVPLKAATALGFLISITTFVAAGFFFVQRLFGSFIPGLSTTNILILMLGGIQLIFLGILGEYLAKIYDEVKQRPLFVIEERMNFDATEAAPTIATPQAQARAGSLRQLTPGG